MSAATGPAATTEAARGDAPRSRFNPFASLRHRDFRFVWSSEMLHLWGTEMENLVLAWFVLSDTGSPLQVGLIGATRFGGTLLAPFYGAVVDRFDRRKTQVFARATSTALAAVLMTLVLTDNFAVWQAYVIVGISSLVRMLGIVVNQALSADTVPGRQVNNAMGLNRATIDMARITGSLLGGALMSALGLGPAYIGVVCLYFASTLAAWAVTPRPRSITESVVPGFYSQVSEGVRYVRGHSVLTGLLFFAFLIEMTTFPIVNELMAVVGDRLYGVNENGVGVMRAVASAGALVGALATGAYPDLRNPSRLLLVTVTAWHLLTLPLAAAPVRFRGRVMGLRALAIYGLPLGLLLGGWLAEEFGVKTMLLTHALLGLGLTAAAALAWPALWRGVSGPLPLDVADSR